MDENNLLTLTLAQGVSLELVRIPEGPFWMGTAIWAQIEQPRHQLILPDYWMGKYTVSVAQYAAFLKAANYPARQGQVDKLPERANYPVIYVTWYDARAFCRWVDETLIPGRPELAGMQARLPGEAEWEKAARGTDGGEYPWGNAPPDATRCNFNKEVYEITPMGQYSPQGDSPYGCADMEGNVWEWTHSLKRDYPYRFEDGRENEDDPGERVVRGAAVYSFIYFLRSSYRAFNKPEKFLATRGFRLCISPIHFAAGEDGASPNGASQSKPSTR